MLEGPSKYDTESRAQVLALHALGKTGVHIARATGIPERTVQRWVAQDGDLEDWAARNPLVIEQATSGILEGIDHIREAGEQHKHLIALNAIRGTAIDKMQRAQSPDSGTPNVMVVLGNVEFNR